MTKQPSKPSTVRSLFGDTAVRLGYVSADQLKAVLAEQQQRRERDGASSVIGVLLQEQGLLSAEQITAVLRHLATSELPLSEDGIRLAARLKVLHAAESNVVGLTGSLGTDAYNGAAEMAVGLAVMEQGRVLLIDADLRAPQLHQRFSLPQTPGFAQPPGSASSAPVVPISTPIPSLDVLPSGDASPRGVAALMSAQSGELLRHYRQQYRYILVNLGPVLRAPEAAVMASRCDGVVAVVRAGVAQKDELRRVRQLLQGLQVGLSGVVLAHPAAAGKRSA